MAPKIDKNPQKRRPGKRFEKVEKIMKQILGSRRPLDVLTRAEKLLELLNRLKMVAPIVCLFEVATVTEHVETIRKFTQTVRKLM